MENNAAATCKVIVHDSDPAYAARIKTFCDQNNLIAVKAHADNIMDVLKSNVDLGAVFLPEDAEGGLQLCRTVHHARPELPIMLREANNSVAATQLEHPPFCASYRLENIDSLRDTINEHIFNKQYPNALIRGIEEITKESLRHLFPAISIDTFFPYLVKDRIIYGELFSLIPIESSWCRGYMMMQTDQKHIPDIVDKAMVGQQPTGDFRVINDVLSEMTNMIWGGMKNRFIGDQNDAGTQFATQVPIIVNHLNRYITFGTDTPQLCFKYTLSDHGTGGKEVTLYQKFIFNLNWAPEKFSEMQPTVDDFINSGDLELF